MYFTYMYLCLRQQERINQQREELEKQKKTLAKKKPPSNTSSESFIQLKYHNKHRV